MPRTSSRKRRTTQRNAADGNEDGSTTRTEAEEYDVAINPLDLNDDGTVSKAEEKAYIKAFGKKAFKEEMARQILLAKSNRASTRYLGNERIASLNQHYWMMAALVFAMWWFLKIDDTPGLSLLE